VDSGPSAMGAPIAISCHSLRWWEEMSRHCLVKTGPAAFVKTGGKSSRTGITFRAPTSAFHYIEVSETSHLLFSDATACSNWAATPAGWLGPSIGLDKYRLSECIS